MNRFETKPTPTIYAGLAVCFAVVVVVDALTPLGFVEWMFYLIPVVLSFWLWRPVMPLILAGISSALIVAGFFFSDAGISPGMAITNRAIGTLIAWTLAGIGVHFVRSRLRLKKEQWLHEGQTGLNERMSGEQNLPQLGDNVLRFLAEFLDAQAGAIYIRDRGSFRRFATYAVPKEANIPESFAPGDGLLGQAVKDSRAFVISDVPEGYLTVGSSLGQRQPKHLLIAPAKADGEVNAVLELGFFHPVHSSDLDLLERVREPIGIAVRSANYLSRLHELLEETQRQSEELQAQSEELRVSNEELEEQSRVLKDSQARLELQQAELEQTNVQLEEQTQRLQEQRDDLEQAKLLMESQASAVERGSRYKSDFLANMSHELRTPLNSSLILAQILAENRSGNLTDEQIQYARTIQSSGNDLLALINDILDLSKIEAGRMEVGKDEIVVRALLENLENQFQPIATQRKVALQFQIEPEVPESIVSDQRRVEQVLRNLLSNAVKFTEQGTVSLRVARAEGDQIAFAITDTGIGIEGGQQAAVFQPFHQADGTTSRKYGGTGLGLSISRQLARLLGGDILLHSEIEKGSTFTLVLPLSYAGPSAVTVEATPGLSPLPDRAPERQPAPAAPRPFRSRSAQVVKDDRATIETSTRRVILIVEDDGTFAQILVNLAHDFDFSGLVTDSAQKGLELARKHQPSAVVLDIGLPDGSGLFVLERLKHDPRTRHIPVHVISAADHADKAMALGATGYMLKPVKREELEDAFGKLQTRMNTNLRRVLVVEDDATQLSALCQLLGSRDIEVVGVQNAADCLERLQKETFDCMVMDLSLPDASGFALLEQIGGSDEYPFPPVIIYTGRELSSDEEQRLRKYSDSIIIKGAKSPERLLDEVALFLHQVVTDLPEELQKMIEKARSRDAALEGRRILLAEDDVRNVFALTSLLEPIGVAIELARNGREALTALERAATGEAGKIDLVLMDIMMPEMDGLTAIRQIREQSRWAKLPIIALTAKAMASDKQECLAAGANDYLSKPLDVEKLLSLIRIWMPR